MTNLESAHPRLHAYLTGGRRPIQVAAEGRTYTFRRPNSPSELARIEVPSDFVDGTIQDEISYQNPTRLNAELLNDTVRRSLSLSPRSGYIPITYIPPQEHGGTAPAGTQSHMTSQSAVGDSVQGNIQNYLRSAGLDPNNIPLQIYASTHKAAFGEFPSHQRIQNFAARQNQ